MGLYKALDYLLLLTLLTIIGSFLWISFVFRKGYLITNSTVRIANVGQWVDKCDHQPHKIEVK